MKIRFTAKSEKAKKYFKKYVDVPEKQIKKIRVVKEEPYTVDVTPRLKGVESVIVKRATRKPHLRGLIVDSTKERYSSAMRSEGLKPSEYDIQVMWK